jgi:hypothetical protein
VAAYRERSARRLVTRLLYLHPRSITNRSETCFQERAGLRAASRANPQCAARRARVAGTGQVSGSDDARALEGVTQLHRVVGAEQPDLRPVDQTQLAKPRLTLTPRVVVDGYQSLERA